MSDLDEGSKTQRPDQQLQREYIEAAASDETEVITRGILAGKLKKKPDTVKHYLLRHSTFGDALGVVTRELHNVADYERVIEGIIAADPDVAKGQKKITHIRIARALGLKGCGTVGNFLDYHPELREKYSDFLLRQHTVEDYERAIDAIISKNELDGRRGNKIRHIDIAIKLGSPADCGVSEFLDRNSQLRTKYAHVLRPRKKMRDLPRVIRKKRKASSPPI